MPLGTPFTKVRHTKDFGAHVILEGATLSESYTHAPSPSRRNRVWPSSILTTIR
ncbi:MAG: hypothetical protein WDM81_02880 [Rhizomicrobium sp.]